MTPRLCTGFCKRAHLNLHNQHSEFDCCSYKSDTDWGLLYKNKSSPKTYSPLANRSSSKTNSQTEYLFATENRSSAKTYFYTAAPWNSMIPSNLWLAVRKLQAAFRGDDCHAVCVVTLSGRRTEADVAAKFTICQPACKLSTGWGGYLFQRFYNTFYLSSPCLIGQHGS